MYQPFFTSRGGAGARSSLFALSIAAMLGASAVAAQSMVSSEAGRYPDRSIRAGARR